MASIQGVYVALFGRPADPTGLAYFNAATNNGANLTAIGDLAATAEYKTKYDGKNNVEIVTAIYQQLFNRNPEATGLNFFVEALNKGTLNINNIAIAILDGAQGSDKTIVDAKIASATAFTAAIDTPVEDASYRGTDAAKAAAAWIATITTTAATADQAAAELKKIVDTNFVGNTVVLAAGNSVVSTDAATLANADKVTTDKNDTIGGTWVPANDKIDGGLGVDTFNGAVATAAVTVTADGLKNIEIINLTATAAADIVDVANAKQATQVWNSSSAVALEVKGLALSTTVGLTGSNAALTTFTFADTTGTSDVANVALNAAIGTGGLTIAGVETLNIANEGTSTIGTVTAAAATAVNISGKDSLALTLVAAEAKTVTNTSTGTVTIDLAGSEKVATYTGSAAVDHVTTNLTDLSVNQAINTGAGNDTIVVGGGAVEYTLTLTGGAGNDLFSFTALGNIKTATAADFAKSLITITDFNAAEDVLSIKGHLAGAAASFNNVDLGNIAAAADLFAAVTVVAGVTGAGSHAVFAYKGDTYIYNDVAGVGFDNNDGLVKIAGLAAVSSLTDANFI